MFRPLVSILVLLFSLLAVSNLDAQKTSIKTEIDHRLSNADSLRRRIKYSDAWNQLAAISSLEDKMTQGQLAKYYKLVGVTQSELGNTKIALASYNKSKAALKKLNTPKSKIDFVDLFTLEGIEYNNTGAYKKAKKTFLAGIKEAEKLSGKDSLVTLKYLYNNLADTYELLGHYDNSVKMSNDVLAIISRLGDDQSVGAGVAHNTLGICYRQLGRYKLAKYHYDKAAEIFKAALGPNSRYTHAALANAATSIDDYGDAEKAIPILMRKLEIYLEDPGTDQIYLTNTYSTLGWIYSRIGDYDKSLDAFERALGKMRGIRSTKKDLEIRLLRRIAQTEIKLDNLDKAEFHLTEAEELQTRYQVLTSGEKIRLYNLFANYYQKRNDKSNAYKYIEKAFHTSSLDSNTSLSLKIYVDFNYTNSLIDSSKFQRAQELISSTRVYLSNITEQAPIADLTDANAMMDVLSVELARAQNKTSNALENGLDKRLQEHILKILELTALTPGKKNQKYACTSCFGVSEILETLVNLHIDAHINKLDIDGEHLKKALAALDIKQRFISNIWNNQYFSSLSPKERELAKELRQRIAAYDLMMFENSENTPLAQKRNTLYLDSILFLRPKLTSLIEKLETKPLNFNTVFDLTELNDNIGIIKYHQHKDQLHLFYLVNDKITHKVIPHANEIRTKIESYNSFCNSESLGFSESMETLKLGNELYNLLIPEEFIDKERIAIIQSYPAEELPFAALLTEAISKDARGFRDIHFAVEKHSFSYHQSLSDYFESQAKEHYSNKYNLTALAPSQVAGNLIASTNSKEPAIDLTYAVQEAKLLNEKYKGQLLTGRQADFSGFTNAFKSSNIVHIASHATNNYDAGEYSYIMLTDTSSLGGERLYARTISELELPTNLVVLGACESGSGKLSNGEGTVSLSNVFLNAGSQAVLHTSWRVEDKRSQEVLLGFYDAFTDSNPLDEALGQAQRTYLQTANGQYLHPFYWAAFEVSGKLSAIDDNWNTMLYVGLMLIAILSLFFFWKRR